MCRGPVFLLTFVLGGLVTLLGCATAYGPVHDFAGDGYRDTRIDANTWSVSFAGNSSTSRDTVELSLLYRCAELTREAGYDYFVVLDTNTSIHVSRAPDTYEATTSFDPRGDATTRGTYSPGVAARAYAARASIRAFKGTKPANDPGAFTASEVLTYLGPRVKQ